MLNVISFNYYYIFREMQTICFVLQWMVTLENVIKSSSIYYLTSYIPNSIFQHSQLKVIPMEISLRE